MSSVGQRVIAFLRDTLGYAYLGNWKDREGNSHIEQDRLEDWLRRQGHDEKLINLTRHDTRVAPEDESTAVMPGHPHPGPLPAGEEDKERLRRIFKVRLVDLDKAVS